MRRIVTPLIAAVAVGLAGSASAADLPVKAPYMAPAAAIPVNNWSGWYVGGNAGYSWGSSKIDYAQDPGPVFGAPNFANGGAISSTVSPDSFIGGGQFGFNYQTGAWVLGLEADINWRQDSQSSNFTLNAANDSLTLTDKQNWFGTVRGRLGVSPSNLSNWLFYATGGLAYGNFKHSVSQFCNVGCGVNRSFSDSPTEVGWTVGGGAEVALNQHWSIGAEYLYLDFGKNTLSAAAEGNLFAPLLTFPNTTASFHDTSQVARLKLNYKF
jgi:outer membrane immunogenic protein